MESEKLAKAAATIMANRLARGKLERQPGLASLAEGYAVQRLVNKALTRVMGPVIGLKIGGTAENTRKLINVEEPVLGEVFTATVHRERAALRLADFVLPGIETEIAVRLGKSLPARPQPYGREEVADAIGTVMAAIEIVDDRYLDFKQVGGPTLAGDNVYNAASILGIEKVYDPEMALDKLGARTIIDGKEIATGTGAALLGHPLDALLFAVEKRRMLALGLEAGTFISLGTMTMPQWVDRPLQARIEVEALGAVEVSFA